MTIGIASKDDLEVALATLLDLAKAEPRIQKAPEPQAFVNSIGATVSITLQYWIRTGEWASVSREMIMRVKRMLDEKGIAIS